MNIQQLKALGLEKRWPRLARLQTEIAGLEKRNREAEVEVMRLRAEQGPARERDLDAEAKAIRAGKDSPEAKHEPEVRAKLERAERDSAVMSRALQAAREDLGHFLAKHKAPLYQDVLEERHKIAQEIADGARAALAAFSKHEDLAYLLKNLAPAAPRPENEPAQRLTTVVAGVGMVQRGPARGEVEGILQHLISLASDTTQGKTDAA